MHQIVFEICPPAETSSFPDCDSCLTALFSSKNCVCGLQSLCLGVLTRGIRSNDKPVECGWLHPRCECMLCLRLLPVSRLGNLRFSQWLARWLNSRHIQQTAIPHIVPPSLVPLPILRTPDTWHISIFHFNFFASDFDNSPHSPWKTILSFRF